MSAALRAIALADRADVWTRAGFAVRDDRCVVGGLRFDLGVGSEGVDHWVLGGVDVTDFDGIPTRPGVDEADEERPHPNGTVDVDHIVLATPDQDRTESAFAAIGLDCRRVREVGTPDHPMQQRFYRLGPTIAEVVGPADPTGDGPTAIWGLAFVVRDIDATVAWYDDGDIGRVKDAVQPGRRIATLHHRSFGMTLPIAFMTPHVRAAGGER